MIWLLTDLTPGAPASPLAGLVASSAQLTGCGGCGLCLSSLACAVGASRPMAAAPAMNGMRRMDCMRSLLLGMVRLQEKAGCANAQDGGSRIDPPPQKDCSYRHRSNANRRQQ